MLQHTVALLILSSGLQLAAAEGGAVAMTTPVIRELEPSVDHNHCTTRQFQHQTFCHEGVWFVFYSDGRDFRCQTSADGGKTWRRAEQPVAPAPNGSSSFDVLKVGDAVYISHAFFPQGRYDVNAPYAKDPRRKGEYRHEGRSMKGRIEGQAIRWLPDVTLGFSPDYCNLVRDTGGHLWIFSRKDQQGVAWRSRRPDDAREWLPKAVCIPQTGRHALDAAALDGGKLYAVSLLTTDGTLYGNLHDGKAWGREAVLVASGLTRVAGDDRRLSLGFDPARKRLHLVYVDARGALRHRHLDSPYRAEHWRPALASPGRQLARGVFTAAVSIDASRTPCELIITYGIERYLGRDTRRRLGELVARRFDGQQWRGEPVLVSQPATIHNWYPNVNQDASAGLCVLYSRSVDKTQLGTPLAVMASILRPGP